MRLGQPDQHAIRGDDPLSGERLLQDGGRLRAQCRVGQLCDVGLDLRLRRDAVALIEDAAAVVEELADRHRRLGPQDARQEVADRVVEAKLAPRDGIEDQGSHDRLRDAGDAEPGRPRDRGPAGVRCPGREEGALVAMTDDRKCTRRPVCLASRIQEGLRGCGRDGRSGGGRRGDRWGRRCRTQRLRGPGRAGASARRDRQNGKPKRGGRANPDQSTGNGLTSSLDHRPMVVRATGGRQGKEGRSASCQGACQRLPGLRGLTTRSLRGHEQPGIGRTRRDPQSGRATADATRRSPVTACCRPGQGEIVGGMRTRRRGTGSWGPDSRTAWRDHS